MAWLYTSDISKSGQQKRSCSRSGYKNDQDQVPNPACTKDPVPDPETKLGRIRFQIRAAKRIRVRKPHELRLYFRLLSLCCWEIGRKANMTGICNLLMLIHIPEPDGYRQGRIWGWGVMGKLHTPELGRACWFRHSGKTGFRSAVMLTYRHVPTYDEFYSHGTDIRW